MNKSSNHRNKKNIIKAWTIVCLIFVCAVAIVVRGVLIYRLYPLDYQEYIKKYSKEYSLDPNLVCAVINTESNFNADVESHKGAVGLMQLLPSTAEWAVPKIGITGYSDVMLSEPETNIRIGCWYLNYLNGLFDGNDDYMLAAYNAGQGNVQKWIKTDESLDNIPFPETENYLEKVKAYYEIYKGLYHL